MTPDPRYTDIQAEDPFRVIAKAIAPHLAKEVVPHILADLERVRADNADPFPELGPLVTRDEIAERLGLKSERAVADCEERGELPRPVRRGRRAAYPKAAFIALYNARFNRNKIKS